MIRATTRTLCGRPASASYQTATGDVTDEHLKWIEQLPLMHVDEHRIFVHAGIDPNFPLDEQDPEKVIWKIYDDRDQGGNAQRHVVHGHHQHANSPILRKNRTNLDTFACILGAW